MGTPRFTPEFKEEAVRQITERGYSVAEVSDRLGVSTHSLYKWLRAIKPDNSEQHARDLLEAKSEILKLRAQLKRIEEERDILKKAARYFAREPDCGETRGRWVIEGDLSSYFDTVHHRLLMKAVRRRISDARFMNLLWRTIKAGHVDVGLFRAASEGVPQGGVISPLLSNIMLNEFDQYLHKRYLSGKARKDRWYWNHSIQRGRSTAVRENWQWKPAVAYCRYADDCVPRRHAW